MAFALVALLAVPIVGLAIGPSLDDLGAAIGHPLFAPALALSLRTSVASVVIVVVAGTPLAWWLASAGTRTARVVEGLIDLPIVLPPAVVGVALLETFGRSGLLGPALATIGIRLPFTSAAVVIAQVVVCSPFYVQATTAAFRRVDRDLLIVARTLGASRGAAIVRIALPMARPGMLAGMTLAWARALGEFGATLLFAGNLPGTTQTMPLAIYSALESDVGLAVAISLVLGAVASVLLVVVRVGVPSSASVDRGARTGAAEAAP